METIITGSYKYICTAQVLLLTYTCIPVREIGQIMIIEDEDVLIAHGKVAIKDAEKRRDRWIAFQSQEVKKPTLAGYKYLPSMLLVHHPSVLA